MYTQDEIYSTLKSGIATVTFTKVDGSVRVMRCTLNENLLPEKYRNNETSTAGASKTLRVYDVELNEWRSFRVESVTGVSNG
jgi:WYL_2, Sm-like SH3 beta-barrel fold